MGGGDSKEYNNVWDRNYSLFSNRSYEYPSLSDGDISSQAGYSSEKKPYPYLVDINVDEEFKFLKIIFIAMCLLLKDSFMTVKNKKLQNFLTNMENSKDCFLIAFQEFCINRNINKNNGYEVMRRFLAKYFSDSTGVFMNIQISVWQNYYNYALKSI